MGYSFLKRSVPTVLTVLGGIGVIATSIMAVKATPKALKVLEEAIEKKGEELTVVEKIKVVGPVYIPAAVTGVCTLCCMFGANGLNKRQQASLASAYAFINNSYGRIKKTEVRNEWVEDELEIEEDELLFYDLNSRQYFNASLDQVVQKVVTDDGLECYMISTPFDVPLSHWLV